MNLVTHLECALCQERHDAGRIQNLCAKCQRPLWVRYDLEAVRRKISKRDLNSRAPSLWRYAELEALGWLASKKKPRMISCQSDGCAPIATAFAAGERFARKFEPAQTIASGIRVPAAVGDFMILDAVRESGGVALATPEENIPHWMRLATAEEGIAVCPETAVCLNSLAVLLESGQVQSHEHIVIFNTGAAQKYPETWHDNPQRIDLTQPLDWTMFMD